MILSKRIEIRIGIRGVIKNLITILMYYLSNFKGRNITKRINKGPRGHFNNHNSFKFNNRRNNHDNFRRNNE